MLNVITDNLDIWTSAIIKKKSVGRGSSKKKEAYGIKKLRELILELAVRGKLIPQDENDEPASVLLDEICKEREQLVKDKKTKKQKSLPKIGDNEKPFKLPDNWQWERLGYITNYGIADKIEASNTSEETWVLELEDVEKETSKLLKKVRYRERKFRSSKNFFRKNDVIYGKLRPYLDKVIVADEEGVCSTEMIPLRGYKFIVPDFLRLVMKSPYFIQYANSSTHGMNLPRMGTDKARLALFPMVSVTEQHRIVAKVNELMALCDVLEQEQKENGATHQILVETLLGTLTDVETQEDFSQSWQRIANHFDILFTTQQSIKKLEETILQLAIQGKLVPQDANDEPASVLLEKIDEERRRLVKEGKIKKHKPLSKISEDEIPYSLPSSWELSRFGRVLFNRDAERIPLSVNERKTKQGEYDYYGASGVIDSINNYLFNKPLLLIGEDGANLINRSTPIAFIAYGKYWVNNHAHVLDGISEQLLEYICLHINAISLEPYITGTAQPKMNQTKMNNIILVIPPLAEQHRIVTKVDELMALCDTLKTSLNDAQTTEVHLADVLVKQSVE